jgi:PEP-CTERM motif
MKLRYVAVVFAAFVCISAPAWSDTISQGARDADSWHQYSQPAGFDFSLAAPEHFHASDFWQTPDASSLNLYKLVNGDRFRGFPTGEHWIGVGFNKWDGSPVPHRDAGDPGPSAPVPEPSAFALLASGLIALLGWARLTSQRRPRSA